MAASICATCGRDYTTRAWHIHEGKIYCHHCWTKANPAPTGGESFERKLERKLPPGSFLGPKVKGSDMRGVFRRNRR